MVAVAIVLLATPITPVAELKTVGFVPMRDPIESEVSGGATFVRKDKDREAGDRRIEVRYELFPKERSKIFGGGKELESYSAAPMSAFERKPPSGRPLGTDCLYADSAATTSVRARTAWERVDISMIEPLTTNADGTFKVVGKDRKAFGKVLECAARFTLARCAGLRLKGEKSIVRIESASVPTIKNKQGIVYVDLDAWAKARGLRRAFDASSAVEVVSKTGPQITIPLGSPKIEVDATWRDLPDIVAERDGKRYCPLEGLPQTE